MANLGIYLAYDNAKEAMQHYEELFGAKIIQRLSITPEMNQYFKLDEDKLADSTYSGRFEIDGMIISCSDRVDNNEPFNDSFNIMMQYSSTELDKFNTTVTKLKTATEGKVIYNSEDEQQSDFIMFRFQDKYNIIWSFIVLD